MKKKFEFIDIISELERVELAPLILPCLKMVDPIAKEIPDGAIKNYLTHIRPKEGQFRYLDKLVPRLPGLIRWCGKIAAIKPVMVVFDILAEGIAIILKMLMPVLSICIHLTIGIIRLAKKAFTSVKQ